MTRFKRHIFAQFEGQRWRVDITVGGFMRNRCRAVRWSCKHWGLSGEILVHSADPEGWWTTEVHGRILAQVDLEWSRYLDDMKGKAQAIFRQGVVSAKVRRSTPSINPCRLCFRERGCALHICDDCQEKYGCADTPATTFDPLRPGAGSSNSEPCIDNRRGV